MKQTKYIWLDITTLLFYLADQAVDEHKKQVRCIVYYGILSFANAVAIVLPFLYPSSEPFIKSGLIYKLCPSNIFYIELFIGNGAFFLCPTSLIHLPPPLPTHLRTVLCFTMTMHFGCMH